MMIGESGLRINVSSAKQSRGSTVCSAIKGNVLGGSIDKDKHPRSVGQKEAIYLRESCYHRIEYSVANSLTVLMRK